MHYNRRKARNGSEYEMDFKLTIAQLAAEAAGKAFPGADVGVDAVAGATISSNAAMDAVQKAIDAFSTVKGA